MISIDDVIRMSRPRTERVTFSLLSFDLSVAAIESYYGFQSVVTLSSCMKLDSHTSGRQKLHCFVPCSVAVIHFLCHRTCVKGAG